MDAKQQLIEELTCQWRQQARPGPHRKDILLVVKDQAPLVRKCLEALFAHTRDFNLFVWDNGSGEETHKVYREMFGRMPEGAGLISHFSHDNQGFLHPNNALAAMGDSPWVILLNSDTEVQAGWDDIMLGWLEDHPNCGAVGYEGGLFGSDGVGVGVRHGDEIDYVAAWCMAVRRRTIDEFGLFDGRNLKFAYGEDSDFCLRLREAGRDMYALHAHLVVHHGNATTKAVRQEMDLKPSFRANHDYIRRRWADYIATKRVLLRYPELEERQSGEDQVLAVM